MLGQRGNLEQKQKYHDFCTVQERQGLSANHRHRIEQLEAEVASAQARLHTANAATEQMQLQLNQSTARCDKAEHDLKIAEGALGSLENEHRKFVDQASAVCSQKDESIAVRTYTHQFICSHSVTRFRSSVWSQLELADA